MNETTFRPGRVLVTGGASGLGAAVVDAVLKAGGTPVVLDRDIRTVAAAKAFTSSSGGFFCSHFSRA